MEKLEKSIRLIIADYEHVVSWHEDETITSEVLLTVLTYIKDKLRKQFSTDHLTFKDKEIQHFTLDHIANFKISPIYISVLHRSSVKTFPKDDERTNKEVYQLEDAKKLRITKYVKGSKVESAQIELPTIKAINLSNEKKEFEDPLQNDATPTHFKVEVSTPIDIKADEKASANEEAESGERSPTFGENTSPTFGGLKPDKTITQDLTTRKKVPLGDGYSQADFIKLTKENKYPMGRAVELKYYTPEEIRAHNKENDAWIIVNGKVYDVTKYLKFHPGGVKILLASCGKDGTSLVNKYHPWVNVHVMLEKFQVGFVKLN